MAFQKKKMLSLPAKTRALLYLSYVWRVIKSSVPGGGPTGEKQMHDRESCHSTGRRVAAASMPSFWQRKLLILECASFMTYSETFSVLCSSFEGIHWHAAGLETLVRSIWLNHSHQTLARGPNLARRVVLIWPSNQHIKSQDVLLVCWCFNQDRMIFEGLCFKCILRPWKKVTVGIYIWGQQIKK